MMRDLLSELKNPRVKPLTGLPSSVCAMDQKLICCDGRGYKVDVGGATVQAQLCQCVASCVECYGRVHRTIDGVATPCHAPTPVRIVNSINQAMVPSRYGLSTIEQFSNFTGNGREVLSVLRDWLRSFDPKSSPGLIVGGGTGVGKTYLVSALAMYLAKQGYVVRFIDFFQLLGDLRAAYADNKAGEELLRPLIHADVLVVDELGKGRHNDFELSVIDQLVMGRYNQRKITVATTNYSLKAERKFSGTYSFENDGRRGGFGLDEMETLEARIGKRTFSRLYETSKIIELTGNDFRRQG